MTRKVAAALLLFFAAAFAPGISAQESIAGTWEGTYDCVQGKTGLTLTIGGGAPNDGLNGNFRFYPVPGNARAASGDYEVAISFDPQTLRVGVRGTRWVNQPEGYIFANLSGVVQGRQLIGTVDTEGCGAFELTRKGS